MIRRVIVLKGNSIGWFKIIFSSSGKRYLYQINNNEDYYHNIIYFSYNNKYLLCMFTFTFEDEFCCDKVDIEKKYSNQK